MFILTEFLEERKKRLEDLKKEREELYRIIRSISYADSPADFNRVLDDIISNTICIRSLEYLLSD